jgi:hypothetical protein
MVRIGSLLAVLLFVPLLVVLSQLHELLVEITVSLTCAQATPGEARPHVPDRLAQPGDMLGEDPAGGSGIPLEVHDERQLMGEDDHLASLAKLEEGTGYAAATLLIDRAGRIVEDDGARV